MGVWLLSCLLHMPWQAGWAGQSWRQERKHSAPLPSFAPPTRSPPTELSLLSKKVGFPNLVSGQRSPQIPANHNISLCWPMTEITVKGSMFYSPTKAWQLSGSTAQLSGDGRKLALSHCPCLSILMKPQSQNFMPPGHGSGHVAQRHNSDGPEQGAHNPNRTVLGH